MSVERVRSYLAAFGAAERVLEFDTSSATVEMAAQAVGCPSGQIAKTLAFLLNGQAILVVAAGDARVDNSRYKARFGAKAAMLTPQQAVELVGYAVGGICPFAVPDGVSVYLDASLRRFAQVYPACGSSNSAIRLTLPELEQFSLSVDWVDVCKDWQSPSI